MTVTPVLIDVHNHLQDNILSRDIHQRINKAGQYGVVRSVTAGTSSNDWGRLAVLALSYHNILPCFGVHPWFVETVSSDTEKILTEEYLQEKYRTSFLPGVGEIGLDFSHHRPDRVLQEKVFRSQLKIARHLNRPIIIHSVKAGERLLQILKEEGPFPLILFHGFAGSEQEIVKGLEMGGYFSYSFRDLLSSNKKTAWGIHFIPENRILLESDMPAPLPRISRDVPIERIGFEHIPETIRQWAKIRDVSPETLTETIVKNQYAFFASWPYRYNEKAQTTDCL